VTAGIYDLFARDKSQGIHRRRRHKNAAVRANYALTRKKAALNPMTRFVISTLFLLLGAVVAGAVTFTPGTRPDPFVVGAECDAPQVASSGGYVFDGPSKFDVVYEPQISHIWSCPRSGYISFATHFDYLSDVDKSNIAPFLDVNRWQPEFDEPGGLQLQLDQMEAIYALRDMPIHDRAHLMRARAWLWRDDPKADAYRTKALALHKKILADEKPQGHRLIINLYIIGFYTWKTIGPTEAAPYFTKAQTTEWIDDDGARIKGSSYFDELIAGVEAGHADDAARFSD
jgi:hypothetical protein